MSPMHDRELSYWNKPSPLGNMVNIKGSKWYATTVSVDVSLVKTESIFTSGPCEP